MIKDFDTFEANLVMSTLSPEDAENECQRSRSLVQFNSQTTNNITLDKTHVDGAKETTQADNDPSNSSSTSKKRNLSCTNGTDFESSLNRHTPLEVLCTKKRRTSTEHRRDTRLPENDANLTVQTEKSPPTPIDLDSENIEVVFQEDTPEQNTFNQNTFGMDTNMEVEQEPNGNQANGRDHRPFMRQIFNRCFTGNTPSSYHLGEVLVENSDEEQ